MGQKDCDFCGARIYFARGSSGKLMPFNDGSENRHDCQFTRPAARSRQPSVVMAMDSAHASSRPERDYEPASQAARVPIAALLFMIALLPMILAIPRVLPFIVHILFHMVVPK
jgi:hypothetical protein